VRLGITIRLAQRRRRAGSVMVEFVLGSGLLLLLFGGTFQFGYMLLQYNKLESAVAQGARYASLLPYDSATDIPSDAFVGMVRNMVLYGAPASATTPIVPDLTPANVSLTVTFEKGVPSAMTVAITGFTVDCVFGSTTLINKPRATYPYEGIWSPL
jgi:Flp pilus assembly protein TadG